MKERKKQIKPPHRIGNVDDGTTRTDWMDEERKRGISITAACVTVYWQPTHSMNWLEDETCRLKGVT